MKRLRIAMLHLVPRVGDLEHNRTLIESAVATAADAGADWVVTPELCLSGQRFEQSIGTAWIVPQPDAWMVRFRESVARHRVSVFLAHAERDPQTGKLHDTVFAIGPDGSALGSTRKVQVNSVADAWASAGDVIAPITVPPLRVGVLVCADAFQPAIAAALRALGAQLLVSPSACPGPNQSSREAWEARSRETGLPMLVCNRSGCDGEVSFEDAESAVVCGGELVLRYLATRSTLLMLDWDLERNRPARDFEPLLLLEGGAAATRSWPREPLAPGSARETVAGTQEAQRRLDAP